MSLKTHFIQSLSAGLSRSSAISPDIWATKYRVMDKPFPGPWSFKHHPWLYAMHRSKAQSNVGQKAAQMGFSEWAMNMVFFNIDIKRISCLYILPTRVPDAADFTASRFNPALENSKYLARLFTAVSNIGHKRAGPVSLYVRGSKSRAGLKSIPAGFLVYDELDEMNQDNIALASQRQSGQREEDLQDLKISTPTVDDFGINLFYKLSTSEEYFFKCPHCSRRTQLIFPECLEITADSLTDPKLQESHLKCKECKHKLEHKQKPEYLNHLEADFVPQFPGRPIRGFTVSQMYSYMVSPYTIAQKAIMARTSLPDEQELYNSVLGQPKIIGNTRIDLHEINNMIRPYSEIPYDPNLVPSKSIITLGVDVGKYLHCVVTAYILQPQATLDTINVRAHARVLRMVKVARFEDLDELLQLYKPKQVVIDIAPEQRQAYNFATRYPGKVMLCRYIRGQDGRAIKEYVEDSYTIGVDRTTWLDTSLMRFKSSTIDLPVTTPQEYKDHIHSMVKKYVKDGDGNPIARYISTFEADHYAHAQTYAEIALRVAYSSFAETKTLSKVY